MTGQIVQWKNDGEGKRGTSLGPITKKVGKDWATFLVVFCDDGEVREVNIKEFEPF